jgi:hypothetical protein
MPAVNYGNFSYEIATICDKRGVPAYYRYVVYQRSPKQQQLLCGFQDTLEEAQRKAETYTKVAAEAWKQYCVSREIVNPTA